jgi:RNA polymerase sigma-70 factor (ECF subfamily)
MSEDPDPEHLLRLARVDAGPALGQLLEHYRSYLELLARVQIGRRLQAKVDAADLVQETFLEAHRHFRQFYGTTEGGGKVTVYRSCGSAENWGKWPS